MTLTNRNNGLLQFSLTRKSSWTRDITSIENETIICKSNYCKGITLFLGLMADFYVADKLRKVTFY